MTERDSAVIPRIEKNFFAEDNVRWTLIFLTSVATLVTSRVIDIKTSLEDLEMAMTILQSASLMLLTYSLVKATHHWTEAEEQNASPSPDV